MLELCWPCWAGHLIADIARSHCWPARHSRKRAVSMKKDPICWWCWQLRRRCIRWVFRLFDKRVVIFLLPFCWNYRMTYFKSKLVSNLPNVSCSSPLGGRIRTRGEWEIEGRAETGEGDWVSEADDNCDKRQRANARKRGRRRMWTRNSNKTIEESTAWSGQAGC